MVSSSHEAMHRIFQEDPGLFARALRPHGLDIASPAGLRRPGGGWPKGPPATGVASGQSLSVAEGSSPFWACWDRWASIVARS
ncbi:hypothetical protein [Streptomyces chilikensis]|uniref:Uncharacterized protein n=1 Tax=Streptomyces chilikensis TaxID=1194079 RepID=A0ABV3EJN3_9ACTN